MTLKKRRLVFYLLVLVFLILGTAAIGYSSGWRVDFDNLTIRQTGAIFVRTIPKETTILLDGKLVAQRNGFLLSGRLIKNLIPRQYELEVKKEGYKPWKNRLPVTEEVVTEVKNIILIPTEGVRGEVRATSTAEFWLTDEEEIITVNKDGEIEIEGYMPAGNIFIASAGARGRFVTYNQRRDIYFLNDARNRTTINLNLMFDNQRQQLKLGDRSGIVMIEPEPKSETEFLITTEQGVYSLDINSREIKIIFDMTGKLLINPAGEIRLAAGGTVWQFKTEAPEAIFKTEDLIKKAEVTPTGNGLILTQSGALVLIKEEPREIAHSVKQFYILNDQQLLFIENDGQANIYYQERDRYRKFELPRAEALRGVEAIGELHLLLHYPDGLYLMEIINPNIETAQPRLYFEKMIDGQILSFAWERQAKKIYYLTETGEFYESDWLKDKI